MKNNINPQIDKALSYEVFIKNNPAKKDNAF